MHFVAWLSPKNASAKIWKKVIEIEKNANKNRMGDIGVLAGAKFWVIYEFSVSITFFQILEGPFFGDNRVTAWMLRAHLTPS